ncbi:MAG: hypothetical protein V3R25_06140 [Nitrosomonadaceae bacterium]
MNINNRRPNDYRLQGQGAGQIALDTYSQMQDQAGAEMEQKAFADNQIAMREKENSRIAAAESERLVRQQGADLLQNGTPDQIAEFGMMNPKLMKDFVDAVEFGGEQASSDRTNAINSRLDYVKNVIANPDSARGLLEERIETLINNGENADSLIETLAGTDDQILADANQDWSVMDSEGYLNYKKASTDPTEKPMTEYQKAMIAGGGADREIRKLEAENNKINNQIKSETNQVKLDELRAKSEVNKAKALKVEKDRNDAAINIVDSGKSTLSLIQQIRNHPGFSDRVGAKGVAMGFGLFDEPVGGTDAAGVSGLIDTLEAQNFLTAIGEFKSAGGAGSLSDNEGKKLGAALSSLNAEQDERTFNKSLDVIYELVGKQMVKAAEQIKRPEQQQQEQQAPSAALQMLSQNPQMAEQFKAKYGYLPEGF